LMTVLMLTVTPASPRALSSASSAPRFSNAFTARANEPFTPVRKSSTSSRQEWIDTW
jgi:hypothetical protein